VWKRPGLAPRDRSIVTLAALIARNQTIEMSYHLNLALDNGVEPREISEIITHLAFYAGWGNAMSAVAVARDTFAARHIGADRLPPASVTLLPINEAAEAQRAKFVQEQFGSSFPGVVQYTTDVLFRDLWLHPLRAPDQGWGLPRRRLSPSQALQWCWPMRMKRPFVLPPRNYPPKGTKPWRSNATLLTTLRSKR